MLKIYGADLSTPANKVRMCANALDLEFEYQQIKIREGEHRSDWYMKLNPVGKVPVVEDDGFTLFESGAICKYLCRKSNSQLYPSDLQAQANVEQWMDFIVIHVGGAMGRVLFNRVFAPFAKVDVDERSLQDGLSFLERFLPIIDAQLEKSTHIASENFSLADITLISTLDPAEIAGIDLSPYTNIVKYRDKLKTQDFYQKTYKEYGEPLKEMLAQQKQ